MHRKRSPLSSAYINFTFSGLERILVRTSSVPTTRKAEDLSVSADRTDSRFWGGQDDAERNLRGCIITYSAVLILFSLAHSAPRWYLNLSSRS